MAHDVIWTPPTPVHLVNDKATDASAGNHTERSFEEQRHAKHRRDDEICPGGSETRSPSPTADVKSPSGDRWWARGGYRPSASEDRLRLAFGTLLNRRDGGRGSGCR